MHRHHFSWPLVHLLNSFTRQFKEWPRVSYKDASLCIVITFLHLVHLLNSFARQFQEWPQVSYKDVSLCIVITFLDLLSIYWIHSHVNLKNGPEYLIRTPACASSSLFDILSIYWIHLHVNFKNGPKYLIRTSACASSSRFLTSCPFIVFIRTSISRMAQIII